MSFARPPSGKLGDSAYMRTINQEILSDKLHDAAHGGGGVKLPSLTKSNIIDQRNKVFWNSHQQNQGIINNSQRLDRSIEMANRDSSANKVDRSNSNIVLEKKLRKSL